MGCYLDDPNVRHHISSEWPLKPNLEVHSVIRITAGRSNPAAMVQLSADDHLQTPLHTLRSESRDRLIRQSTDKRFGVVLGAWDLVG